MATPPDVAALLPVSELTKSRTPADLIAWVDDRCRAIADVEATREPALMHYRPFKEFYEEVFPLSRFVSHAYAGRTDVSVTPNLDNRPFDALIHDCSVYSPSDLMVEITLARDPQEHLRMEYFVKHGHVSMWSPLKATGNKRNRQVHVEPEAVEHRKLVDRHCRWIKAAAEGKASKADHYGHSHVLVIAFEDFFKPSDKDIDHIRSFVNESVLTLPLNFSMLYVVSMSGKTCIPFALGPVNK